MNTVLKFSLEASTRTIRRAPWHALIVCLESADDPDPYLALARVVKWLGPRKRLNEHGEPVSEPDAVLVTKYGTLTTASEERGRHSEVRFITPGSTAGDVADLVKAASSTIGSRLAWRESVRRRGLARSTSAD